MMELKRGGTDVTSVFDLLGRDENDLTGSLAFALSRCPSLSEVILRRVWPDSDSL